MSIRTPGSIAHKLGPFVHRLQPKTLRGRLALAVFVSTVFGVVVTFSLVRLATMHQFDQLAEVSARQHVAALRTFLTVEQDDVELNANLLASASERHLDEVATSGATPKWLAERLRGAHVTAFLRVEPSGRTSFAEGPSAEVSVLRALLASDPATGTSGLVWGDGHLLLVAAQPLDDRGRRGFVALARPVDEAVAARFTPLSPGVSIAFSPPSATQLVSGGASIGGFRHVLLRVSSGEADAAIELPGMGSPTAAIARLDLRDSRLTGAMAAGAQAALGTAAVVGLLAAVFGVILGAAMEAPIDRTRRHLRAEAPLALEGLPYQRLTARPETTVEFRGLASDVDSVFAALQRRQSELVEATAQARAAEESLRATLDGSPEGKLLVDIDTITLANPAAERILGVPLPTLLGSSITALLDLVPLYAEDGHRLTLRGSQALAAAGPVVARLDGEPERWVEVTDTVLVPDPLRVLLTVHDITEERRLDTMREEIFSIVSHDLRAPLTVVQGYLDILERPLQPEARRRALDSARHNAAKMADLLEDLLDATAADRLLTPKVMQPVDVLALAADVASSLRGTAPDHIIEIAAEVDRAVVSGEERRLRQALMNLVTNALKYAPGDTTVTIRVSKAGGDVLLAIEDQGPGVPDASRQAVFERYGRLASTAEGKPGFGLGLYIVRVIAEKHGGRALVEDAPGGGARFVMELPSAEEA